MSETTPRPNLELAPLEEAETTKTAGEKLQAELRAESVETTRLKIPESKAFTEILLFPKKNPTEPPVRVYRGINHLNADVLRQVSYALRSRQEESDSDIVILEHARKAVENLANQPTHENLLAYLEAVWPDVNDKELTELEEALTRTEDGVLEHGWSLRLQLTHNTYEFGGAYTDMGLTPYLSGTTSPDQAVGYGRAAIMVLDLPSSKVEAMATSTNAETAIKAAIDPEDITAILIRDRSAIHMESEELSDEIRKAIGVLDGMISYQPLSDEALEKLMSTIRREEKQMDVLNREKDLLSIQKRRAKRIMSLVDEDPFSEEDIVRVMSSNALDRYSAVKQLIYDRFVDRFVTVGGRQEALTKDFEYDYTFGEGSTRIPLYCDRNKITDEMLRKMKRRVEFEERRVQDLAK